MISLKNPFHPFFSRKNIRSPLGGLTKNSVLATLLVTVCRRILPVRRIDPAELTNIPVPRGGGSNGDRGEWDPSGKWLENAGNVVFKA